MPPSNTQSVPVWDLPTRLFHWSLVVLVLINLVVEPRDSVLAYRVHVTAGYLIAALVVFRLVWGVIGSPRARFTDFVTGWATVRTYARRLVQLDPPHSVGHNPLGGWMIVALLSTLTALVLTGSGRDGAPRRRPARLSCADTGRPPDCRNPRVSRQRADRADRRSRRCRGAGHAAGQRQSRARDVHRPKAARPAECRAGTGSRWPVAGRHNNSGPGRRHRLGTAADRFYIHGSGLVPSPANTTREERS